LHGQNSQQHLAVVAMQRREAEELRRLNSGKSAHDGKRRLHIRARLHGQNSQQHLADGAMWYREAAASRYHSAVKRRKATQEEEAVVSEIKHRQKSVREGILQRFALRSDPGQALSCWALSNSNIPT
jgi:hypothetical protein